MTNEYYQKPKERHRKDARDQIFLKKEKRQRKVRERYQNLSGKQEQKSYLSILEIVT